MKECGSKKEKQKLLTENERLLERTWTFLKCSEEDEEEQKSSTAYGVLTGMNEHDGW